MADLAHDDDAQSKDECAPSIENSNSAQQAISIVPIPEDICLEVEDVEQLGKEGADSMAHTTESPTSPSLTDNKLDIRNGMRTPHKTYTMQYKLSVLDWYYANGENKKRTSKHFGVDRKRIRDWLRLEQKFRMEPHSNMQCTRIARGCPPQYQELDTTVLEWYKEQRAQGQKVTNRALRTKALELAPQFGFQDTFKASSNWAIAWRRRNRDTLGESSASVEDHTLSASATDFDEDLHGLNSESGFATVAEAINGVRACL